MLRRPSAPLVPGGRPVRPGRVGACCCAAAVLLVSSLLLAFVPPAYREGHPTVESYFLKPRRYDAVLAATGPFPRGTSRGAGDSGGPGAAALRYLGLPADPPGEYPLCAVAFFLHSNCSTIGRTAQSFADILGPEYPVFVFLDEALLAPGNLGGSPDLAELARLGRIRLRPLFRRVVYPFNSRWHELNQVFTTPQFWHDIPCKQVRREKGTGFLGGGAPFSPSHSLTDPLHPPAQVLVFQEDTTLCSTSPFKVADFMRFDFVGAPWPQTDRSHPAVMLNITVGNGGFSIRTKAFMLLVLELYPFEIYGSGAGIKNEDMWCAREPSPCRPQ